MPGTRASRALALSKGSGARPLSRLQPCCTRSCAACHQRLGSTPHCASPLSWLRPHCASCATCHRRHTLRERNARQDVGSGMLHTLCAACHQRREPAPPCAGPYSTHLVCVLSFGSGHDSTLGASVPSLPGAHALCASTSPDPHHKRACTDVNSSSEHAHSRGAQPMGLRAPSSAANANMEQSVR